MNPDLTKLVAGGAGEGVKAPNPMDAAAQTNTPPVTAPMATPQPQEGSQQAAMVNMTMAMDLLEASLASFGSESEEGQALLSSLSNLSRKFGASKKKTEGLIPAEIMQMMQTLPQAGGGSPQAKAMNAPPPMPMPQGGGMPPPPPPM
jgi:hypothetical protein